MDNALLFLAAVLTLLATPGPTNTLLATSGATVGVRRSLPLLGAEVVAYLAAIVAMRALLGPLIIAHPKIAVGMKLAVAGYLGVVALGLWRSGAPLAEQRDPVRARSVFVTTLLNPKALIFALTIIPAAHSQLVWFFVSFAVTVPLVGLAWIVAGRALGAAAGQAKAGLVRRIASVAQVGFAAWLVASALG